MYLPAQELTDLVQEGELLFEKTRSKLLFPKQSHFDSEAHFYSKLDTDRSVNFLQSELKRWQSEQSLQDIGLVFKASARYNFTDVFDNENNNFNIGQVRAELEWNILKSGYINNKIKAQRLQNERLILQNNQFVEDRILMRRQFRIDYTFAINLEALELLENFVQFENEYFDFLNKLYFKKYIKREQLIEVSQQINVLKTQMNVLEKETQMIQDSVSEAYRNKKSLPFLKLKIDSLSYMNSNNDLTLQRENIYLQHKPINDLSLSLYVQETVNYSNAGHRFFPSMGIRFKAPIRFNHRKKIIQTKVKILEAQHADQSVGKSNRIITLMHSYNEKLKDVQNQYKSWKVIEERIRVLSILKQELNQQETGMLLLELLQEKFRVLENMIQLKRQMYTSLSHLFEVTETPDIESIASPMDFTQYDQNLRFALTLNEQFDLTFQIKFLQAKGCSEVEVLERDKKIQKALLKAKIPFYTVSKLSNQEVAFFIQKEMLQIQRKP
jgi:hypothetical protein